MKFFKQNKLFSLISAVFLAIAPLAVYAVQIPDPLQAEDPYEVVARVIQAILGIVGVVVLINFVIAGLGIILSRGNPEKLKKHKDTLAWTVIGMVLIFGAYAIIAFVLDKVSGVAGA